MTIIPTLETCKALDWKKPTLFQCGGIEEIPSPTFSEIWEELPDEIEVKHLDYHLEMTKSIIGYINYDGIQSETFYAVKINGNLAEAAAQLFLKLKENNLLK